MDVTRANRQLPFKNNPHDDDEDDDVDCVLFLFLL